MKRRGRASLSDWWARPDSACVKSPESPGEGSDQECEERCGSECHSPKKLCFSPASRETSSFYIGEDAETKSFRCEPPKATSAVSSLAAEENDPEILSSPCEASISKAMTAAFKGVCTKY